MKTGGEATKSHRQTYAFRPNQKQATNSVQVSNPKKRVCYSPSSTILTVLFRLDLDEALLM